jgi:hypothetical protein
MGANKMQHDQSGGLIGWACTSFLFVLNMVAATEWSAIMTAIAAGATATFYIARTIEIIKGKNKDGDKQ